MVELDRYILEILDFVVVGSILHYLLNYDFR